MSWSAESGNTPSRAASTSAVGLGLVRTTTSAIDDTIEWNVEMAAGTWSIRFIYVTHSGGGTHAVKIDGTTFATLDTYSAGDVYNVTSTTTAVAVASSGIHVLSSVCTGKHASSADEDYIYTAISGVKTA